MIKRKIKCKNILAHFGDSVGYNKIKILKKEGFLLVERQLMLKEEDSYVFSCRTLSELKWAKEVKDQFSIRSVKNSCL
jgi:hypothetical protein